MQSEKVRVGIIGAGAVVRITHVPGYAADPRVEVVGITDLNQERAGELGAQFNVAKVYPSADAMLSEGRLDAVSICVANAFHAPLALQALRSGADVLVEKPMALSTAEAAEMVREVRDTGKILMVGMNNRFAVGSEVLSRYARAGWFGNVYHARAMWLRRRGNPGGWFTNSALAGGGVSMDVGVHAIDLAWWLMGKPRPVRVSAVTRREIAPYQTEFVTSWPTAERPTDAVFDVEDFMSGFVRFDNGATLEASVAWAVNGPQTQLVVDLYGEKGGASLDPLKVYTEMEGVLADVSPVTRTERSSHTEEIKQFITAVQTRGECPVPVEDGLALVSILEAIRRSSEEGREVEVESGM